jgi:hypothetical protein
MMYVTDWVCIGCSSHTVAAQNGAHSPAVSPASPGRSRSVSFTSRYSRKPAARWIIRFTTWYPASRYPCR